MNIANIKNTYFENIFKRLHLIVVIYCIENWIKLFRNRIGLLFLLKYKITPFYLLLFVFIRFINRCHSLPLAFIFCYLLSFVATRCHSLSLTVPLLVSPFVTCCHSLYHSLSLVVARCHSLSLDVPLVCFFINYLVLIGLNTEKLYFLTRETNKWTQKKMF